jgi:AGZA family xanthine/uracil permease-like MFS transporter
LARARYPIFVKRDLDGFFGLAIDNLVQLLLIVTLCESMCGMTGTDAGIITELILPGVAVSLVIGNLFYALQAHWVARREGRSDVTALPYGINTPSLLVYIYFVMAPAWQRTQDASYAWKLGLIACLGSGVIEFTGAFVAERVRRNTPRAALLSTLAGIAITFISMKFALEIWQRPLVAMVPMAVVLLVYFANVRFPLGLPGGLVAVLLGTGIAWLLTFVGHRYGYQPLSHVAMDPSAVQQAWQDGAWHWPQWVWPQIWETLTGHGGEVLSLMSVIIPMGLFNVIGSLQNIESAEAGGDVFATGPSLAVNGIGTIAAALFGSCFPTTIYIGHPGWKGLGARAGYSTLNAIVMSAICLTGTVMVIGKVVPIEAGIAIVLWIGIVITAQAFQATPVRHAPAVAIGLFPAIAAWGATIVAGAFSQAGANLGDPAAVANTMQDVITSAGDTPGINKEVNGFLIHGMIVLERGYIFTCMVLAAISAFLIDRRFKLAAVWSIAAAILTFTGLIHAYTLLGNVVDYYPVFAAADKDAFAYRGHAIGIGYVLMAVVFVLTGLASDRVHEQPASEGDPLQDARVLDLSVEPVDE